MTFDEAEAMFRDLYNRMQRGAGISRAEYEDRVSRLAVQDERGVWWEIHPHTARWMYFDGLQWVDGIPPGRSSSAVIAAAAPSTRVGAPLPTRTTPSASPGAAAPRRQASPGQPVTPGILRGAPSPTRRETATRGLGSMPSISGSREWIPFAIGSVVLFACAILLFFGGRFVLGGFGPQPSATQVPVAGLPTRTPFPTAVPLPTQPPPTPTPVVVLAKVIEARVNVRAAPSTQAEIIGKIERDDVINLIGRNADTTWYQVTIAGRAEPAWVFAATLEVTNGDATTLPVVNAGAP